MHNIKHEKIDFFCDIFLQSIHSELSRERSYGCVNYISNGSHTNMNYKTFLNSANVIVTQLKKVTEYDIENFANLRNFGLQIENSMFKSTNGINTHKGLIFLILFIFREWIIDTDYENISNSIKEFSVDLKNDYINPINSAKLHSLGINDIRTFPLSGYEFIFNFIDLIKSYSEFWTEDKKTLYLIEYIDDTTTVNRSSLSTLRFLQNTSKNILKNYTESSAEELNKYYIKNNISSGGVADVLTTTNLILNLYGEKNAKIMD